MPRRSRATSTIRVIRFTNRIARQCALGDARLAEWAVCEAIANGSRRPTGRRGIRGGRILRFEKVLAPLACAKAPARARGMTVAVLGELIPRGCFALRLLKPAPGPGKNSSNRGFFNRAGSK